MASVTKADIPIESSFMTEFWKFIKAFYIPEESDDYWQALIAAGEDIYARYPTDMAKALLCAYMDYLDKKYHKEHNARKEANHGTG